MKKSALLTACILSAFVFVSSCPGGTPRYRLVETTQAAGIQFCHNSPPSPEVHMHLSFGSGVGWVDYDRDGWPDLFFCQGQSWAGVKEWKDHDHSNRLYRNGGDGTFADVTTEAGLRDSFYAMGVCAGDYDNDGFADLYVTSFGRNRCYRNNGDGTFTELAGQIGIAEERFSSASTWSDVDADGDLDLYVVNYLKINPEDYPLCGETVDGRRVNLICHPRFLPPEPDALYRNEGDGRFTDITKQAGLTRQPPRQGLGIVTADLDRDGDSDFYVANDTTPNYLWNNLGDGTFRYDGMISGTALNRSGQREAGMGVAVGDVDGNGYLDLFVTHYYGETNTLYRNEGGGLFVDVTNEFGLAAPSLARLSFGNSLFDLDCDGFEDFFVACGHIEHNLDKIGRSDPLAQLPQLYLNRKGMRFQEISRDAGPYFQQTHIGRGSATADYDRDGRVDVVVSHSNDKAALLHNETTPVGNVLRIELIGTRSNRDGIGATVEVHVKKRKLLSTRAAQVSYLSCNEAYLSIGLGQAQQADRVVLVWPGGRRERWDSLPAGVSIHLIEGTGKRN